MVEKLHRLTLQVTPDQYESLKKHSKPGTSISSIVRIAIDKYFEKKNEC